MSEKPILFNAESIRAILAGRKTQTRRVIKADSSILKTDDGYIWKLTEGAWKRWLPIECSPYGQPGDTLWVREAWHLWSNATDWHTVSYAAMSDRTYPVKCARGLKILRRTGKKNALWMPREFSRITLRVLSIRVERAQDISDGDISAEGVKPYTSPKSSQYRRGIGTERIAFANLWDSINDKRGFGWHVNPFVWVVEFEEVGK